MSHLPIEPKDFEADIYNVQAGIDYIPSAKVVYMDYNLGNFNALRPSLVNNEFKPDVKQSVEVWTREEGGLEIVITFK